MIELFVCEIMLHLTFVVVFLFESLYGSIFEKHKYLHIYMSVEFIYISVGGSRCDLLNCFQDQVLVWLEVREAP